MAKEFFRGQRFQDKSLNLINYCNRVIKAYQAEDLQLTLRQLYYQLVSANKITNTEKSYKNLGKLVSNGRLAGLMDWSAIEDRVRRPIVWSESDSIQIKLKAAAQAFRLPRLNGQSIYVELWVEKDALAGVLEPMAAEYHVVLMVNRGYSSQSAMYESARRINRRVDRYDSEKALVLYLGDMDPSGEDMVRDIDDRLDMFSVTGGGIEIEVVKLALTMEQVREYKLPPNPTKLSDSRAKAFIKKWGRDSWEVDALPPKVLQGMIGEALKARLDMDLMGKIVKREDEARGRLNGLLAQLE